MKKNVKIIIIAIVSIIIIASLSAFVYVYLQTDYFKKADELFYTYLSSYVSDIEDQFSDEQMVQYSALLSSNPYNHNININLGYIEGLQTTNQTQDNEINNFSIDVSGSCQNDENYSRYNIDLKKEDESLQKLDFIACNIEDNLSYGIYYSDFDSYLGYDSTGFSQAMNKMQRTAIEDMSFDFQNYLNNLKFSSQDLESLSTSFGSIIKEYTQNQTFTKTKEKIITVNSTPYETNEYKITMPQETFYKMVIAFLKQAKQDEVIKNKEILINQALNIVGLCSSSLQIEITSNIDFNFNPTSSDELTFNQYINSQIDDLITEIESKNSSTDNITIAIYENMKKVIRASIDTTNYSYELDMVPDGDGTTIEFNYKYKSSVKENSINIKRYKTENGKVLRAIKKQDDVTTTYQYVNSRTISGGNCSENISMYYEVGKNRLTFDITNQKQVVTKIDKYSLDDDNFINISSLTDLEYDDFKDENEDLFIQIENSFWEKVNIQNIVSILKDLDIISEDIEIDPYKKLTQTEINKFNSTFEIYEGEKVSQDFALKLVDTLEPSIAELELPDSSTLKFTIKQNEGVEVFATKARQIIEDVENKNYTYDIYFDYDEDSGVINAAYIKINTKK